jgi:hypothetical protein
MSSSASKDRASLCLFTFNDGRRCRTPRIASHPHFCFYHARKESQSQVAKKLAGDLSAVFTRDYVSACDLSTVLGRLLVAVARGDIKPKAATTIASLARTLAQTIRLAQHEYINAFGTDGWRQAVCDSVNQNFNHLTSSAPDPGDAGEPSDPEDPDDEASDPEVPDPEVPDDPAELETPEEDKVPDDPAHDRTTPEATEAPVGAGLARPEGRTSKDSADNVCNPSYPDRENRRNEGPSPDPAASTIDETRHSANASRKGSNHSPQSLPTPPQHSTR